MSTSLSLGDTSKRRKVQGESSKTTPALQVQSSVPIEDDGDEDDVNENELLALNPDKKFYARKCKLFSVSQIENDQHRGIFMVCCIHFI